MGLAIVIAWPSFLVYYTTIHVNISSDAICTIFDQTNSISAYYSSSWSIKTHVVLLQSDLLYITSPLSIGVS
jgi:hypothetical protein